MKLVIVAGGLTIMYMRQGVGSHAIAKGAVVCGLGIGLAVTGLFRRPPPEEDISGPRLFDPETGGGEGGDRSG